MNKPLVIGHRGAMGHETENTLASIQKAMDLGVDMIEIDVFKIKSGETVVFHDEEVERLTDSVGKIEDYNFEDLQKLTLIGDHKIPTLQEVLNLIDKKVQLNIELKGANTADRVNFIMNYYIKEKGWSMDKFIISSFRWDELKTMRTLNADVPIAILVYGDPLNALEIGNELDAVAINPYFEDLTLENVNEIKKAGFKIYPWTVNEPEEIEAVERLGVDGIITNYPERIN
ncbi:glycerophosphoryl diester phosphodiesterase [Arenibacter palladensis]|uniref:Glycerophosphoryl diester phosphodiesterase n=1 Tax=Arenibacter palladensis TaxID=237373 RepID=A0A1M4VLB3_9FLAO|nr:glycerophosphodiester phosphodiesterase family protein [Arenibacter palladensis]MDO6601168.1 glycerophosphodiester phosphodiesterase family protein [Arenibacter palladensis]SHE69866.1 glycerophosphoryl diester phosphodiesterase [Arenibacter palladensis]